ATTYAWGTISGPNSGGLVGANISGSVSGSYWNSGANSAGFGYGTAMGADGRSLAQMQSVSNLANFQFSSTPGATGNSWVVVDVDGTLNNAGGSAAATLPMLTSEYSTKIANGHQLQLMAMNLNGSYLLAGDIDVSASYNTQMPNGMGVGVWVSSIGFVPIGNASSNFNGHLDGLGNAINGLAILSSADYTGLFRIIGASGRVANLTLSRPSGVTAFINGGAIAGALAGANYGTISNVKSTLNVTANDLVGGLVGYNNGVIVNGYSYGGAGPLAYDANPTAGGLAGINGSSGIIQGSLGSGAFAELATAGGLVGINYGLVNNSQSTGTGVGGIA